METIQYRALKKFRYGDRVYKPGEIWEPQGGRWDDKIIAAAFNESLDRQYKLVRVERLGSEE